MFNVIYIIANIHLFGKWVLEMSKFSESDKKRKVPVALDFEPGAFIHNCKKVIDNE